MSFLKNKRFSIFARGSTEQIQRRASSKRRTLPNLGDDIRGDKLFHTICAGSTNPLTPNFELFIFEQNICTVFEDEGTLRENAMVNMIKAIDALNLDGQEIYDQLRTSIFPKAIKLMKKKIDTNNYLESLEKTWSLFYTKILPNIDCLLYSIQLPTEMSVRKAAISSFRDHILINSPLEEKLKEILEDGGGQINRVIEQMILVIQSIPERIPSKGKLAMESVAALAVTPYLGYHGLFVGHNQVVRVTSREKPQSNSMRSDLSITSSELGKNTFI